MKIGILLGSLLLVGCAITPKYHHPTLICVPIENQKALACIDAEKFTEPDKLNATK